MVQEKSNDRKQYVEQIRQSFRDANAGEAGDHASSYENAQEEEDLPRGYFKLRLFVSAVLFLAFVFIWKTGWSYGDVDAAFIQEQIQTNITLPESLRDFRDIFG